MFTESRKSQKRVDLGEEMSLACIVLEGLVDHQQEPLGDQLEAWGWSSRGVGVWGFNTARNSALCFNMHASNARVLDLIQRLTEL